MSQLPVGNPNLLLLVGDPNLLLLVGDPNLLLTLVMHDVMVLG
jgi:hypothetical protein